MCLNGGNSEEEDIFEEEIPTERKAYFMKQIKAQKVCRKKKPEKMVLFIPSLFL